MIKRHIQTTLFCILIWGFFPLPAAYSAWFTYSVSDGLPGNTVYRIFQDGNTYAMWFVTNNGFCSFDGHRFKKFDSHRIWRGNPLWEFELQDSHGNLWLRDRAGYLTFINQAGPKLYNWPKDLSNVSVRCIRQAKDNSLWFATAKGVRKLHNGKVTSYLEERYVFGIKIDNQGNLWFGTDNGGYFYNGEKMKLLTGTQDVPILSLDEIEGRLGGKGLSPQNRDKIWFLTYGRGVIQFSSPDTPLHSFRKNNGLADDYVLCVFKYSRHVFWFGTLNGVTKLDSSGLHSYTKDDGLANNYVHAIYEDAKGELWFHHSQGKVSHFDGRGFLSHNSPGELGSSSVSVIKRDRNASLWFGTNSGLIVYDGHSFRRHSTRDGLPDNHINDIFFDKEGNTWVATNRGVGRYRYTHFAHTEVKKSLDDAKTFLAEDGSLWLYGSSLIRCDGRKTQPAELVDFCFDTIQRMFQDPFQAIWIQYDWGGVAKSNGQGKKFYEVKRTDVGNFQGMFQDKQDKQDKSGNVYQAYERAIFKNDKAIFKLDKPSQQQDTHKVFSGRRINSFLAGNDNGWVITEAGVEQFSPNTSSPGDYRIKTYRKGTDILYQQIYCLLQDDSGKLWIGTDNGVHFLENGRFIRFSVSSAQKNPISHIFRGKDGKLLFANRIEVFQYDGKQFIHRAVPRKYAPRGIIQDASGDLWFITRSDLIRYDGSQLKPIDIRYQIKQDEELKIQDLNIFDVFPDNVLLWISTNRGVIKYDRQRNVLQIIDSRWGIGQCVYKVAKDGNGRIYFLTDSGLIYHTPSQVSPTVRIVNLRINGQKINLKKQGNSPPIKYTPNWLKTNVVLEAEATSFNTLPDQFLFRFSPDDSGQDWSRPTRNNNYTYRLGPGSHNLLVKALNRDLKSSKEAKVKLEILYPLYLHPLALIFEVGGLSVFLLWILNLIVGRSKNEQAKEMERKKQEEIQQRLQNQIAQAEKVQALLFPTTSLRVGDFEIAGCCKPAHELGGDFYNYVQLNNQSLVAYVADIAGDGLGSALKLPLIKSLSEQSIEEQSECLKIVSDLNKQLFRLNQRWGLRKKERITVALGFCQIHLNGNKMDFCLASAPSFFIRDSKGVYQLDSPCQPVLGIRYETKYRLYSLDISNVDTIVLYTDGIIEAYENHEDWKRNLARIISAETNPSDSALQIANIILNNAKTMINGKERYDKLDDISIVVIRRHTYR